jgi:hypothetical protein
MTPPEVLLAVTHLPELAEFEDKQGHHNTVFVGDFNMNPYDQGMTLVNGVHGLMTARLARMGDRLYRQRRYRRFYNPM